MAAEEKPSDEADREQLAMAREEGDTYQRALDYMVEKVADAGAKQRAGDYLIGFAQERAEGMYHLRDGDLAWVEPSDENCHLEVAVADAGDGRFIPGLSIKATLTGADGAVVGPFDLPFLWHPGLYHYGRNVRIPGSGRYTVRIEVAAPDFPRHDKVNGRRYAEPVSVEFKDVALEAGRE